MRAWMVSDGGSRTRRGHLLCAMLAGAIVTMGAAACGGTAPATEIGETMAAGTPAAAATPAVEPAPAVEPTPALTPGPAVSQMPAQISWDIREGPGGVSEVFSTGELLVAVGTSGMTEEAGDIAGVWTSPDGRTWEAAKVAKPSGTMAAVAAGPGRLVAVGMVDEDVARPAAWTSVDGRTWERLPASAFAGSGSRQPGALEDVAAGPEGFVVVGSEFGRGGSRAAAWHSADGLTWTHTPSNLRGVSAGSVVQFGSGYVAAGWDPLEDGDARALFWTSQDGRTWAAAPDAEDLHDVGSAPVLAAAGQHLVAFGGKAHSWGGTEATVWTSQDGVTWEVQASSGVVVPMPSDAPPASGEPAMVLLRIGGLIGTDGGFIAAGGAMTLGSDAGSAGPATDRRVVWTSPTGATWSVAADIPEGPLRTMPGGAGVGPIVVHQGELLVLANEHGSRLAPLWATDLSGMTNQGE